LVGLDVVSFVVGFVSVGMDLAGLDVVGLVSGLDVLWMSGRLVVGLDVVSFVVGLDVFGLVDKLLFARMVMPFGL
jgi:hypothetical protein